MLADFADDDGTIKRRRMSRLLRDLDVIEESLREHGKIAFDRVIDESSEWTTRRVNRAVGLDLSARQFDRINKYRSEERRVGKERRIRGSRGDDCNKSTAE